MKAMLPCLVLVCLFVSGAAAQTSLQLSQLQLRYRVLSRSASLNNEQKAELKKIEDAAAAARAKGNTALISRELHRGIALMEGRAWTAHSDFTNSLVLAPEAVVCDPANRLFICLRQQYPAPRDGGGKLTAHVSLSRAGLAAAGKGKAKGGGDARPLGQFPVDETAMAKAFFRFAVEATTDAEAGHQLNIELRDGEKLVHRQSSPVYFIRDFDSKRGNIEGRLALIRGFDQAKASIRYPFDFAQVLNSGRIEPAQYDFLAGIARSEELLKSIEAGKDPLPTERGVLSRHYKFEEAGEVMPYRLVVPKSYDGSKAVPLIIVLHGLGGTENTFIQQGNGALPRLAEERGFIVATPLGYRRNGGYGRPGALDKETARMTQLSEQDVLNVLRLVRENYKVDPARIYLMGHSMGGGGTWTLGSKHATIWAGLAPIASGGAGANALPLANLKQQNIPVYCVHGDADRTAPVEGSRSMVAELKKLGVEHEYHEIPGGTHGDVVGPAIPKIVEFFLSKRRATK